MESAVLKIENFSAFFGENRILKEINLSISQNRITAIMGPSGCGKTTLIRCINRMHELIPDAKVSGKIFLDNEDIYATDPIIVRRQIGMVFQKPNPFPTMSIYDNVIAGYNLNGIRLARDEKEKVVEESLRKAALWEEVNGALHRRGTFLSGGQQQRLCIARVLAVEPEVILMDEPCSALDPVATLKIEDLMRSLAVDYTIIIVTHNMQQAARVSDTAAFMMMEPDRAGVLVEYGPTAQLFTNPKDKRTEDYITGRFG
jgi:phosphate transport system ATP-binding protein